MFSEVAVAFVKMFLISPFFGLYEFFACFILYMAYLQINHCSVLMYIVFCLFNMVSSFVMLATNFQHGSFLGTNRTVSIVFLILFFYYIGAIYFAFPAYKEFKAHSILANGGGYSAPPD